MPLAGPAAMLISYAILVVGSLLFAGGVATGNAWLIGPGLVLVPVGLVTGLRR